MSTHRSLLKVAVDYTRGMRAFHWCVRMLPGCSQDRAGGTCGRAQPITLVYQLSWAGCSQPVGRDAEVARKCKVLKIYHAVTYYYL